MPIMSSGCIHLHLAANAELLTFLHNDPRALAHVRARVDIKSLGTYMLSAQGGG